ncbi:hypothetical protein FACS1894187_05000 [Synergistales bacterium]|nr:hypothetical protein FACS1894187_05000 [Synergistales bacterium]
MPDGYMTLMDLKNRLAPGDNAIASVAEIIAQENEVLEDIPWKRGNLITGDRHLTRAAMPHAVVRKINEGVAPSVSKTEAHTDTCIELASMSVVDVKEVELSPNPAQFLLSENRPHIAILGEDFAASVFYGKDSGGIMGFAARYGKLPTNNTPKTSPANQVIDAGGTGTNLNSIYIVKWDAEEVTAIYPMNAKAGLQVVAQNNIHVPDKGDPPKLFLAHVTNYSWFVGLKVRDYRYAARVANIDLDALLTDEALRQKLFEHMIRAKNKIHHVNQGRTVMYVSPDLYSWLEIAAFNKVNMALGYTDITSDRRILRFSGIPIKRNDCQTEPETAVA